MPNNKQCLSCHQEHDSGYAFCKVCLPWCVKDKDDDLELLPKLEELSIIEFLENPEYELLSLLSRPQNEVDWGDIITEIYESQQGSEDYARQFSLQTNDLLDYISHIEASICNQIERISAREFLALSYYSHFDDLNPNEIVGDSTIVVDLLDYEIEFEVFRTKDGEIPSGYYTPPRQNEYASTYSLRIAKINGTEIRFDEHQIERCAELIDIHSKASKSIEACIEVMKKQGFESAVRLVNIFDKSMEPESKPLGFITYNGKLPATDQLWMEFWEICAGNRGSLAKDLLICTMYRFEHLDIVEPLLDSSRVRSFQFLSQIVSDLSDNVTPIQDGLLVESITGNCYQIERTKFKFAHDDHIVFWSVHEIYTNEFICIEPTFKGPRLPDGDYLAALVLSLYDDHESSNLIHTLAS